MEPRSESSPSVSIPYPLALGALAGLVTSLSIIVLDLLPDSQGHALLMAAISTPYIVFALLDGSTTSLAIEFAAMVGFMIASFIIFDAPAWVVAIALASHALWDYLHRGERITKHVGDYATWCSALDLTAAITLIAVTIAS